MSDLVRNPEDRFFSICSSYEVYIQKDKQPKVIKLTINQNQIKNNTYLLEHLNDKHQGHCCSASLSKKYVILYNRHYQLYTAQMLKISNLTLSLS